eukprot:TRINITY_DN121353_c0_g1_i1.p1 TRINITY_DN121353_c0_g1~~TRINITY_DN121353_c0_g1_i1.p1  ORF type:complete len:331 (-),score=34.86 TRINITY_DN121353_c0_g1_i1:1319-2311(-)
MQYYQRGQQAAQAGNQYNQTRAHYFRELLQRTGRHSFLKSRQENELKQKEAKMKKLIEAAEETYSQSHLTDLRLEDARQKANKERKIFEQEWQRIQEEIEKRKWPQIKEDAKEYKEEAKKLKDVIGSIQRKIASPGGSLKTPRGLKSEPSKTVFSKKVTSIRPFHKVRTLEDLEREEESERNNLYEKSKELENIEQNIEKLKKETNIATIQGIGESYQIYVEKDAQLAKEVQYLDEEVKCQEQLNKCRQKNWTSKQLMPNKTQISKKRWVSQRKIIRPRSLIRNSQYLFTFVNEVEKHRGDKDTNRVIQEETHNNNEDYKLAENWNKEHI